MAPLPSPDTDGLIWGYTQSFWHVLRAGAPPVPPVEQACKWFGFLPASSFQVAQDSFGRLAKDVLRDPSSLDLCHRAKLALAPLYQAPDRLVVVFYGEIRHQESLLALIQRHAKAERKRLLAEGHVKPRDGFLAKWTFKTEAQTRLELETKTSPAHVSLMMQMMDLENQLSRPARARKPK